jgi:hypothetical protein
MEGSERDAQGLHVVSLLQLAQAARPQVLQPA